MPESLYSVVTRAEELGETGQAQAAAGILTRYLEAHPKEGHPYPYYDAGYFLQQAGKPEAAVGYVQKAVKLNPCFGEAWQLLASLYRAAGERERAAMALEKAAGILKDPDTRYQTAVLWIEADEPEKALALLKPLHKVCPTKAEWYVATARAHQALKANGKAAEAMASAYALSKDPEQLYQCAVFWLEDEKPARALPLLQQLTNTDAPKSHWLVALSNSLKALKKKAETAEAMERAARINRDPKLLFHAAWLWIDANRPKKALPLLKELAERKRPKVDWLLALANTYVLLDQTREAALTLDRVVRIDPQSEYLYNAGVLWLHAEGPDKALAHLVALCKRSPPRAEWFVALAHAWLRKKEIVNAAKAMEKAAGLSGKPQHAYQAGLMWLQARNADAALRVLVPLGKIAHPEADWLVALSNAWILKGDFEQAAWAMERAARISEKADYFYSAATLWLQADRPRKALPLLEGLAKRPRPEAKWLVLLSETWVRLGDMAEAARAMERAAGISGKPDHTFRSARLWLEADQPKSALPLLESLAGHPAPLGNWFMTLSNCYLMLGAPEKAAGAMEKAAEITGKGDHYYRAGMLYMQAGNSLKGISLLHICVQRDPVEQKWLVSLAQALVDAGKDREALPVMERTVLIHPREAPSLRFQGAMLWLVLEKPQQALPILKVLCTSGNPDQKWLVSLVKTHVELGQMGEAEKALRHLLNYYPEKPEVWRLAVWVALQQSDYAKAAAAMAVAVRLGPPDAGLLKELADLYHMAGTPMKAASALQEAWQGHPTPKDWDRLVHTYLSGHRYDTALPFALSAAKAEPTSDRWETVGAIAFRLRKFKISYDAYCRSAELSPDADLRLKAGYAAIKLDRLEEAAHFFREAMRQAQKNSPIAYEAHRNLAFIKKMMAIQEKRS